MANSYLNKTFGTPTDTKKYTMSVWVKRATLGVQQSIARSTNGNDDSHVFTFNSDDTLRWDEYGSSSTIGTLKTNRKFRDISAWYHVVLWYDSANSTAGDRMRMWINGVEETSFATDTNPSLNADSAFNKASQPINIGRTSYSGGGNYFDGYLAHMAFVDGANVAHTTFGETDSTSGIWKFKSQSGITWGTNGFHLKFENSGNLGLDSSSNASNWTVNGNLTQSVDTPSINYVTLNPLLNSGSGQVTHSRANTRTGTGNGITYLTMMPTTGKWFCEFHFQTAGAGQDNGIGFWSVPEAQTIAFYSSGFKGIVWKYAGNVYVNGSNNAFSSNTFTSGDIISIAMDMDNSTATFYKNGSVATNLNAYSFPFTEREAISVGIMDGASASAEDGIFDYNSGANGTFGGRKTAGGNSDANGQGDFSMAVPSGYYALNTKNLNTYG